MNNNFDPQKFKELLSMCLEITFTKLLKQKQAVNGFFVFSENGHLKRIKATDILISAPLV